MTHHLLHLLLSVCAVAVIAGCGSSPPSPSDPTAAAGALITCRRVDEARCRAAVELVRGAAPGAVEAASEVIVVDTCPPEVDCDRNFAFDSAVIVVPASGRREDLLVVHVVGRDGPERVEAWQGPLPEHIRALIP